MIPATGKTQVERVVRAFAEELVKRLGGQIYEVIWYGSTARGDAEEESDIDVAVICQSDDAKAEDFIWTIASEFGLEHDTFLDVRVISGERFYGEWGQLSYLAEDIQKEGIPIWKRSERATATN
ncbi:nucleotidyltransferase domain-containing protein [candidate division KSB1 bacterium]|nr:nucleotidyltransferase domain-containing protein [candidate division KSB1 bacterium]